MFKFIENYITFAADLKIVFCCIEVIPKRCIWPRREAIFHLMHDRFKTVSVHECNGYCSSDNCSSNMMMIDVVAAMIIAMVAMVVAMVTTELQLATATSAI